MGSAHGGGPHAVMVGDGDGHLLDGVARLIAAAVGRREALGLAPPLTVRQYRAYLAGLLTEAGRGDAGLAAVAAADGGPVLASAQWRRSGYATRRVLAELDRVVVDPVARGSGLGRRVVEGVAADAAAHGVELLALEVRGNNHAALALYAGLGFEHSGVLPNAVAEGDARHDIVLMSRELGRPASAELLGSLPAGLGSSLARGVGRGDTWLRTDRLLLCRPALSDAADHFAVHADPATNVHNPAGPQIDPAVSGTVLALWERQWRESGYGYWTVRHAGDGAVIGFGGVRPPERDEDFANLYYRFRPSAWGRGYATELGRAALDLAARVAPGLPVTALIRPANAASIRVATRIGLRPDGEVQRQLGWYLRYTLVP